MRQPTAPLVSAEPRVATGVPMTRSCWPVIRWSQAWVERVPLDREPARPASRRLDGGQRSSRERCLHGGGGEFLTPESTITFDIGRIPGRRHDRKAPTVDGAVGGVRCRHIRAEDPDRPLVDDRMMKRQHEDRFGSGEVDPHRPQERPDSQIERRGGLVLEYRLKARFLSDRDDAPRHGDSSRRQDPLHEFTIHLHKRRPQRRMAGHDGGQRPLHPRPIDRPVDAPRERDVVGGRIGEQRMEEPHAPLRGKRPTVDDLNAGWNRRQGHGRFGKRRRRLADPGCKLGEPRRLEHGLDRQADPEPPLDGRHQPHRQQRMATTGEKPVVAPHRRDPEQLAPDRRQGLFGLPDGSGPGRSLHRIDRGIGQRQRSPIELAVGGHREGVDAHEPPWHHRLRKPLREEHLQRLVVRGSGLGKEVGDEPPVTGADLTVDDHSPRHSLDPLQLGLDLPEFDADAADLHLCVEPAEVLDFTVRTPPGQIAGAVHPLAGPLEERVGEKPLGGQIGATEVSTRYPDAGEPQLSLDPYAHWPQRRVEDIRSHVRDRPTDRHRPLWIVRPAFVIGHVDRGFRWPVEVVEPGRNSPQAMAHRGLVEGLTAGEDVSKRATGPLQPGHFEKDLEHRRHEVDDGDARRFNEVCKRRGLPMQAGRRHHDPGAGEERPEELPYRHVEAERRLLEHAVAGVHSVGVLHPPQTVDDPRVRVHHPLWGPGRARRVDHVGQIIGRGDVVERSIVERGEFVPLGIDLEHLAGCSPYGTSHPITKTLLNKDHRRCGAREHRPDPGRWIFRVERQIRAAGGDDSQQRHNHLHRPLHAHGHRHVAADAPGTEESGQTVHPSGKLGVGEEFVATLERHRRRCAADLCREELLERGGGPEVGCRGVEVVEDAPPLVDGEQIDIPDRHARIGGHRPEERDESADEPLDFGAHENIGRVLHRPFDPVAARHEEEREVETARAGVDIDFLHPCRAEGPRRVGRLEEHEHHVGHRMAATGMAVRNRGDDLVEGQLPVVKGREKRVANPSDRSAGRALRQRGVTSPADTDGKRVEETANLFFEAFHGTPRDRRGDDRVVAAGHPMDPRVKRREQGSKKGGVGLPGDPPPGVSEGTVEPEAACFTPRR
jgi:hypothetical protein